MSTVKIYAHPETKALFTPTSNPDYMKCRVESEEIVLNNGVMRLQKRTAFPLVETKVADYLTKSGLKSGSTFPVNGKIVRKLTSEPQYDNQQPVINPSTGEVMDYFQTYTFTSDQHAQDVDERIEEVVAEEVATDVEAESLNQVS